MDNGGFFDWIRMWIASDTPPAKSDIKRKVYPKGQCWIENIAPMYPTAIAEVPISWGMANSGWILLKSNWFLKSWLGETPWNRKKTEKEVVTSEYTAIADK